MTKKFYNQPKNIIVFKNNKKSTVKHSSKKLKKNILKIYIEPLQKKLYQTTNTTTLQIQEFRTGATRQNMEAVHSKEEVKRLRSQVTDSRGKLNDAEAKVR